MAFFILYSCSASIHLWDNLLTALEASLSSFPSDLSDCSSVFDSAWTNTRNDNELNDQKRLVFRWVGQRRDGLQLNYCRWPFRLLHMEYITSYLKRQAFPISPARINRVHLISFSWNSLKPCQASYTTAQQLFDEEYREVISIEKHWTDWIHDNKKVAHLNWQ